MEKRKYTVVLQPGTDEPAFLANEAAGMEVASNLNLLDSIISMRLTDEEVSVLLSSDLVIDCELELPVVETTYPVTPEYTRNTTLETRSAPSGANGADYSGTNFWFHGGVNITANSGPVGFFTGDGEDAEVSATINQNYAGEYVDIVAIEAGTPLSTYDSYAYTHPDFLDANNNPRFVKTDWTTYESGLASQNQATANTTFFSAHAIGVLSAAGGTYCGWSKVSSLRVVYLADGVPEAYNGVLNFHQNKPVNPATGVRNATIVTGAWGFTGVDLTGAAPVEYINKLEVYDTAGNLTTINRPGGGWGTDFTPFTDNLMVPRVINDPADSTDKWMIAWNLGSRYTTLDTIMNSYNNTGGIYHFDSAGNNSAVGVGENDPRKENKVYIDNSVSAVNISLDGDGRYVFNTYTTPSSPTSVFARPCRLFKGGGANQITIAACQHSTINPLLDDYSNRGPMVDVAATGAYTWTSYPTTSKLDGTWGYFSGTSCAGPVAAGTASIMICDFFVKRGVYPTIAQLKEIITNNSKQVLESEGLEDFSSISSPGNKASTRLYSSFNVFRISEGDSQNGGSDLSDLFGTPTDRIYLPYSIRLGTGKYINSVRGPAQGRRPSSGQAYPRRKIVVAA